MLFSRFIAGFLILLAGVPSVMAGSEESAIRPRFSWDTVPQWLIVRKATSFTDEESRLLAAAPLVVFEKANGHRDSGTVEDGTLRAARAVKELDPSTVTLFYWNAVINYPLYRANDIFDRNRDAWALKKNGEVFLFKDRYAIYNHLDRGLQDWWITTAKGMASDPAIDGIMIDAICKTDAADDGRRSIYPGAEYGRAYFDTAMRLKKELGGKLLVGNALRASKPQFNMQHLEYLDGSYVEGWAHPMGGRIFADYVADGMNAMSQALADGKLILFNAGPVVVGRDTRLARDADYASRERWMKQHIRFPLAVFLMVAEPGAYFHYGTGPDVFPGPKMDIWRNDIYDELCRPLGKPIGPASVHGHIYTRQFEHLDVSLDLERREATFAWH
jgi:hypothetical protein